MAKSNTTIKTKVGKSTENTWKVVVSTGRASMVIGASSKTQTTGIANKFAKTTVKAAALPPPSNVKRQFSMKEWRGKIAQAGTIEERKALLNEVAKFAVERY